MDQGVNYIQYISILIASIAIFISFYSMYQQRKASQIVANIHFLNDKLKMLNENPDLLQIHGITKEELASHNLKPEEVIYMLNNIYSGQAFYGIGNYRKVRFGTYRTNMLDTEKFEKAWKNIIRDRLTIQTPFSIAIDSYYESKTK